MDFNLVLNIDGVKTPFKKIEVPSILKRRDIDLFIPNDGNKYVQILHDYEFAPDYKPRQYTWGVKYPIPAICNEVRLVAPNTIDIPLPYRGKAYDYVRLTSAWQFFMRDLWRRSILGSIPYGEHIGTYVNASNPDIVFDKYTEGSLLWYYTNMIQDARSHTDADSPETGSRDYVTNRNPTALPYSWMCKTTTGNILKVLRDLGNYWEVEALDLSKEPPKISDLEGKHHLLHWATEQSMDRLLDKTYAVSDYPQAKIVSRVNGYPDTGTPIPNVSLGGKYLVSKSRTKEMKNGQRWSPYNPFK